MLTKTASVKNEVKASKAIKETSLKETEPRKTITKSSSTNLSTQSKKQPTKTRITVKYDVGFPRTLYIRGKGANLSWDLGVPLTNSKSDEWIWETETSFSSCEFKVLIDDEIYEAGENHQINGGEVLFYTPFFS